MATQKQIEANRRNAQKSTGPTTEEGKQRSRINATKHGLAAMLPHEDAAAYHLMRAELVQTWQPANAQEFQLVDAIASAWHRMQRASRFESGVIQAELNTIKRRHNKSLAPNPEQDDTGVGVAISLEENEQAWAILARYESRAQSAYYRAIDMLRKLQNDRRRLPAQQHKAAVEQVRYFKSTVADPNWQPSWPITPSESSSVGSFSGISGGLPTGFCPPFTDQPGACNLTRR